MDIASVLIFFLATALSSVENRTIIGLVLARIFEVSLLWFAVNLQCDGCQATGI